MVIKKFLNLRKTKVINWLKKLHEKSGLWLENRQKIWIDTSQKEI